MIGVGGSANEYVCWFAFILIVFLILVKVYPSKKIQEDHMSHILLFSLLIKRFGQKVNSYVDRTSSFS